SAGRIKSRRVRRGANRAARALRLGAQGCPQAQNALGAVYRRLQARGGGPQAGVGAARGSAEGGYRPLEDGGEEGRGGKGGGRGGPSGAAGGGACPAGQAGWAPSWARRPPDRLPVRPGAWRPAHRQPRTKRGSPRRGQNAVGERGNMAQETGKETSPLA